MSAMERFVADWPRLELGVERELPQTPAGRFAVVDALLNPVCVEICPHCGSEVEKRGEPLISRESALQLLGVDFGVGDQGVVAIFDVDADGTPTLVDSWDANGSPVT